LWFIPTLNPEGHNVVTANLDVSYRKNKRDNNNNGIFDFNPVTGGDIDGVDINRNLPLIGCMVILFIVRWEMNNMIITAVLRQ
jgi:hypothetical protein